jgi:hypothetical protein
MSAFDLFCTTPEGTGWVATFLNIDVAKSSAELLAVQVPGRYFIVDQVSGSRVFELRATDGSGQIGRLRSSASEKHARREGYEM